ncbi:MAG: HAD family hydrolase [Oscillospiraceae bacterium]|nr:HAD family hydrolase [Oscillospiraceae bacterium]
MRLQSAVFCTETALLGKADAGKVLSILKMEGVWLYAVTALSRAEAEAALRSEGLADDLRGILTESEALCALSDGKMYEKAMRRLRSQPRDTVVFAGRLAELRAAKEAGMRAVAVRGAAEPEEWEAMRAEATEAIDCYADFLA